MTRSAILCGVLLTVVPTPAAWAQQPAVYGFLGGGGTNAESANGGAFTLGVAGRVGPLLVTFTPVDLIVYSDKRTDFDRDLIRCGESSSPAFTEKSPCVASTYGYSFDAAALIPRTRVFTGLGARFERDHNQLFGTAGYAWFSYDRRTMVAIKGRFGDDLVSAVVNVGFRIGR